MSLLHLWSPATALFQDGSRRGKVLPFVDEDTGVQSGAESPRVIWGSVVKQGLQQELMLSLFFCRLL